jgi:hypothetical protein
VLRVQVLLKEIFSLLEQLNESQLSLLAAYIKARFDIE